MPKTTNTDNRKMHQFSVRFPERILKTIDKRIAQKGFTSRAEYVRHLIIEDINGLEDYYGQTFDEEN